jgi:hypothetical protein
MSLLSEIKKVNPPRLIHGVVHAAEATADHIAKTAKVDAAEAVGYAELAGFRYPVKAYHFQVSPTLTRGSRLDVPGLADLATRGFKGVVNLCKEYDDSDKVRAAGLHPLHLGIIDNTKPTEDQMKQFLDFACNPANQQTYVHCEAGMGRTGVSVACYRMAVEGWTDNQAIDDGKKFGLQLANQIEFLHGFYRDLMAGKIAGYPLGAHAQAPAAAPPAKPATPVSPPKNKVPPPPPPHPPAEQFAGTEAGVLAGARKVRDMAPNQVGPAMAALQKAYDQWRAHVADLIKKGSLDSAEVKSFARKVEQASLVQVNMPPGSATLAGSAYRDAAMKTAALVSVADKMATLRSVCDANPLLCVPRLAHGPSLADAKKRGIKTKSVTIGDPKTGTATGEARTDVVVVFCPGVVRTNIEFGAQGKAALELGLASSRAETGTFIDAEVNAKAVADAVQRGKDLVGNPDAKVILVGYSQGNTNLYAFLRDKDGTYQKLRSSVIAVHDMHSAANGSRFADLAFAIGRYLGGDDPPSADDQALLDALYRSEEKNWHLPEKTLANASVALRKTFHGLRVVIHDVEKVGKPVLEKLGIHLLSQQDLGNKLVAFALRQEDITEHFVQKGGLAGNLAAKWIKPLWDAVTSSQATKMLKDGLLHDLLGMYVDGGLRSLSTQYGAQLMGDPRLGQHAAKVFILNSVGAVPAPREPTLVPPSQRLNYTFFNERGWDNDYQVAVVDQKLESRLKNAVDCYTQAIGHWGVAGVLVPIDHPATYFKDFSPPGLTRSALMTMGELGIV